MIEIKYDASKMQSIMAGMQGAVRQFNSQLYQATFDSLLDVRTTTVKPGYSPYKTGTLRRSFNSQVTRNANTIVGVLGTNVPYARIHEFGGQTGRKHSTTIKPKLYLTRAIDENKKGIQDRFRRYLSVSNLIR